MQLGTVLTTLVRHLEVRLDQPFPGNNYHVRFTLSFLMHHLCTHVFVLVLSDDDHDAIDA